MADAVRSTGPTRWPLVGRREELELGAAAIDDGHHRGVVIHGAAGVGKSRLAEEMLSHATAMGRPTRRARGSVAAATVPLGALVHLLPRDLLDQRIDPVALYRDVVGTFEDLDGTGTLVVLVDDLQWLDVTSATLLGQLLDGGSIFLVGTVRSGEPVDEAVATLWRRDDVMRVDLDDLGPADVDTLLHLALGGPVHAGVLAQIQAASAGNALFVKELVLGACASGKLVERRGVWWLTGPLEPTPRLTEVVERRLSFVSGAARSVVELLAVWESVGLGELESLFGARAVDAVDQAGLLDVRLDGRRHNVALAHPLHGEAIRSALTPLARRRLLLERADRIEQWGMRRRGDLVGIAMARLEGAGSAAPDLLAAAARLARYGHDFGLVERLTRAPADEHPSADAVLLRAEALHELGHYPQVEELLLRAEDQEVPDEELRVQLAAMRVRNLMWGLQRHDEALAVNREARTQFTDQRHVDELITDEAITLLYSNRPLEALRSLETMSRTPSPRARVLRSIAEIPALIVTGRCETALAMTQDAHAQHRALGDQTAIAHPGVHIVYRMQALIECGRLDEATMIGERGFGRASRGGPPLGRDWFALGLGRAALLGGRPRAAQRWLSEGVVLSSSTGFDGPHRLELSLLAVAQAWLGDADGAQRTADEADRLPPTGFYTAEQNLGRAWAAVAAGDVQLARSTLLAAAGIAADGDHRVSEALLLHDVARLGEPANVVRRLAELAAICEGALVPVYADHARAAADHDGVRLDEVSRRFEALGMLLLAAETSLEAADAHRRHQTQRPAAAAASRAELLLARCEGARTPRLRAPESVVPLTAREREIGALAGGGLSSKQIAERLYLSVRTVDNHLQNVYTKLGVTSRAELSTVFAG